MINENFNIENTSLTTELKTNFFGFKDKQPVWGSEFERQLKIESEEIINDWVSANKLNNGTMLRYFNPVGAHASGQIGEEPDGVPNNLMPFIAQVAVGRQKYLSIYGNDYETIDGTGARDYIHVVDLAVAHVKALSNRQNLKKFEVINIGRG